MRRTYALIVRSLVSRARVAALLAIAAIGLVLGFAIRAGDIEDADRPKAIADFLVGAYGLNLVVPVCALVFASAAFGDMVEDRTLVYLWLTPVSRWKIVAGAAGAAFTVALPISVIPVVASAAIAGGTGKVIYGTAVGATLAVVGYTSLFLALGLVVKRALAWGLAYVLVWELAVARIAKGAARLSISVYSRSALAELGDLPDPPNSAALVTALIVLAVIAIAAPILTSTMLSRAEVA